MAKVGLVLSGGMAKGAYQIGVLRALREHFAPAEIAYTAASSVGVLNAYAFHTEKLDFATQMWKKSTSEHSRRFITAMLRSEFLQHAIDQLSDSSDLLAVPLLISLYHVTDNRLLYYDLSKCDPSDYREYLRASVAMPLYNRAVVLKEGKFFDGAMIDNIPVFPISQKLLDYVICVYFDRYNYTFESREFDTRVIKITFPDDKIISNSVLFRPDGVDYMLERGYIHAKSVFSKLFAHGTSDMEYIFAQISKINLQNNETAFRITGDFMVTNLNKVAQKITRRCAVID